uniref:Exo/endonuclease G n=1 Tax=Oryctolagus cuniculus TaxID=9986 RepID=A0A5F9DN63_RABIT
MGVLEKPEFIGRALTGRPRPRMPGRALLCRAFSRLGLSEFRGRGRAAPLPDLALAVGRVPAGSHRLARPCLSSVRAVCPLQLSRFCVLLPGDADRKHCKFKPDPNIPPAFSAFNQDYVGSGWSRGHMAPAGNNKFSSKAMAETFYLSNIVPQDFDNNSGIWNRIEMYCRELTERFDDVWIVSGPLTLPQTGSDGKKTVSYQVRTCLSRLAALSGIMTHSVCLMPFSAVSIEHLVGCQSRGCRDGYCKELIF